MNTPVLPDHLHQLVHLYLAMGHGSGRDLDPHERQTAIVLLRRWLPTIDEDAAKALVDTAHAATRSGVSRDVEAIARDLRPWLSPALRQRVVSDLGQLARADGHLSMDEARKIRRVRAVWASSRDGD